MVVPVSGKTPKSDPPACLKGHLLLADPSLRDGIFDRSVILVTEHAATDGAGGFILNHPTGRTVGDFLKSSEFAPLRNLPVHAGGPVAGDQLTFSSFWWSPKHGLRWSLRLPVAEAVDETHRPGRVVRAFVGYSGWSPGQLEGELRRQSWLTTEPASGLLCQQHDHGLWTSLLQHMSPYHAILSLTPRDPFLN